MARFPDLGPAPRRRHKHGRRRDVTASGVRIPHARLIMAAAAIVASAAILWLSRGYTFYFDEWSFILTAPDWTAVTYLQPHNEHPSILFRLVYAALLDTVGLRSYLPYMAVLLLLHSINVVLLFELVRRRAGDLIGVFAAAMLLVLGAGWEDILWAFQIAWLASVALGLAMFIVLQPSRTPRRLALAAGLVTGSLMFSGIGLAFAAGAAVTLFAQRGRRQDVLWLAPVAVALAAWYVAFGRDATPPNPPPSAANIVQLPVYALWGLGAAASGLAGLTGDAAPLFLAAAAGALGWTWWRHHPDPTALGTAAGLVSFFLVTGLARAQFGYHQAASGRYVYVAAVFWLILLADAARGLPWRGTWRPALVACVFLACFNSGVLLFTYAVAKDAQMQREGADLYALRTARHDPCLDPNGAVDPLVMPLVTSPAIYYRAIDLYGDPALDQPLVDHARFAVARANLVKPVC
ncbi:MAG: hypothetical protein ACHQ0J_13580 [Candidatus Dormibacterales bacterium]